MSTKMRRATLPVLCLIAVLILGGWGALSGSSHGISASGVRDAATSKPIRLETNEQTGLILADADKGQNQPQDTTIGLTSGTKWPRLTPVEIANLAERLKIVPKSRAQIKYENPLGIELANTLMSAFMMAGWNDVSVSIGTSSGPGILIGWSSRAVSIKAAIESVSGLKIMAIGTDREVADLILVKIGVNTAE